MGRSKIDPWIPLCVLNLCRGLVIQGPELYRNMDSVWAQIQDPTTVTVPFWEGINSNLGP
jgi:hypothetical protein